MVVGLDKIGHADALIQVRCTITTRSSTENIRYVTYVFELFSTLCQTGSNGKDAFANGVDYFYTHYMTIHSMAMLSAGVS